MTVARAIAKVDRCNERGEFLMGCRKVIGEYDKRYAIIMVMGC